MFYSVPDGLVLFCSKHIPPTFVQDPLSLLWVPEHCVSPLFLLLQRCQAMKSAARILSNYVEKTVKERDALQSMQSEILAEVKKMKERLAHRVHLQETGERVCGVGVSSVELFVDPWSVPSWVLHREGFSTVSSALRECHAGLQRRWV